MTRNTSRHPGISGLLFSVLLICCSLACIEYFRNDTVWILLFFIEYSLFAICFHSILFLMNSPIGICSISFLLILILFMYVDNIFPTAVIRCWYSLIEFWHTSNPYMDYKCAKSWVIYSPRL